MSVFDDLITDMDGVISGEFGDEAILSALDADGGDEYPIQAIYEQGVQSVDGYGAAPKDVVSIPSPPIELKTGQLIRFIGTGVVLTLREELEDDGHMAEWAVTKAD